MYHDEYEPRKFILKCEWAVKSGATFVNLSEKELPVAECHVYGFSFSYDNKGAVSTSLVLPGGLHIGSTVEDIIAAYGEPTETNDSSEFKTTLRKVTFATTS